MTTYYPPSAVAAAARKRPFWLTNLLILILIAAAWPISHAATHMLAQRQYRTLNYPFDILIHIGIAIILAVSLNLINGITGQFSLGHCGFMAIGAYVCGVIAREGLPLGWMAGPALFGTLVLAGLLAAAAGVLVGVPSLRLSGDYLAIATLGFGQIIVVILNKTESIGHFTVGGSAGLHDIPVLTNFFWTFGWALVCVVTVWRIAHCLKGKSFWAVSEDEIASAAVGIDPTRVKVTAFVLGAFFAGVAGGLYAMWEGNLSPGSFNFMKSIEVVVMVVLGGSGSIAGSILAAAVLTWLPEQLRFMEDWRLVIYALLLISMMLLRPQGLLGRKR
ncbi:MAG: branched-chain amino acid ABC transporter permease [Tepidisphaeraceae bacterium]|jgi:branched-chain amino acid transport system permease protein